MSEKQNNPGSSPVDAQVLIEEMACAIADAQAALLTGRFEDLEHCTGRMQELCACLKVGREDSPVQITHYSGIRLVSSARRVQLQNNVFAASLRRMRRHLETLRNLLNGPSLSYQPQPINLPERRR